MSFFKNLFQKQDNSPIKNYSDFWNWFEKGEKNFYKIVNVGGNIEKDFFDLVSPKLEQLHDGIFLLTGMYDKNTAELVFTPEGNIKNFVFVKDLVEAAPKIDGWRFTAFKPYIEGEDFAIEMNGFTFNSEKLFFYANVDKEYPDEIDLSIYHVDCNEKNKSVIGNGSYIFLDNYLGELEFATTVDNVEIVSKPEDNIELIPIDKLRDYLIWREKEFVDKYEGIRYNTENDAYSSLEATRESGIKLIAIVNTTLMEWDAKPSHPWILTVKIFYDGKNNNGFPDDETYQLLNQIEEDLMDDLKDFEGYLNIGRETSDNVREIYFACKEFNKPSKAASLIVSKYLNVLEIEYEIFKDKYWLSLSRFNP